MSLYDHSEIIPTAVLVGICLPGQTLQETSDSLNELDRLVATLGYRVIHKIWQKRDSTKSATILGEGKLKELANYTGGSGKIVSPIHRKKTKAAIRQENEAANHLDKANANEEELEEELDEDFGQEQEVTPVSETADFVIFDCDLSPSQLRNIENATNAKALDRTGVIIEIFSRHAKTRASRLQVEIARLSYLAPRLRETSGFDDRGSAGGMGGKGAGESSLELDRRAIRDRIKALKDEFSLIDQEQENRRSRRNQENTVCLVGYTNAGKSSLMRALTGNTAYVANKLFATLDTTVRSLEPPVTPNILISDTVGFIKKLPHDLIASFRSTLDEAKSASLLLFVVDASDPNMREQLAVTQDVLSEIGADEIPRLHLLNKIDQVEKDEQQRLSQEFPGSVLISTFDQNDVQNLKNRLIDFFDQRLGKFEILVPYQCKGIIGDLRKKTKVLDEAYNDQGFQFTLLAKTEYIEKLRKEIDDYFR